MLDILRRIVQEVSGAGNIESALSIIVTRVRQALSVDACSVFLVDRAEGTHILMATDGHNLDAVGRVRIAFDQGLISVVMQHGEPVNLEDAQTHPNHLQHPELNDTEFHAYLGVPIIHHRDVVGVIVVRQRECRRYADTEVAFLITMAAQLAGAIVHAQNNGEIKSMFAARGAIERSMSGIAGAPGIAMGTAMVVYPSADLDAIPDRRIDDIDNEVAVFEAAVDRVRVDIEGFLRHLDGLPQEDRALFDAYLMMLGGEGIVGRAIARIREGTWASAALRDTIREHTRAFEAMEDPYLRERASDVRDLGRRILVALQSGERKAPPYPDRTILVGDEISATMLAEVPRDRLAGVVSVRGSGLSHVAILAHALGVPAVLGVEEFPVSRVDYCEMVVDGYRGRVYISPTPGVKREYLRLMREEEALSAGLAELKNLPSVTADNVSVPLYANTGLITDLVSALQSGAQGIGLHRTEFPFMIRTRFPGEDEQREVYQQILAAYSPRPVVIRTLDIGGDKSLPYFPIREDNPFLGWRGIRITLDHPEIFVVQIRALLRASRNLENLSILLPMISTIEELEEARAIIDRTYEQIVGEESHISRPLVGMMVEVPSVIFMLDEYAPRVDFFSVGTNDLTQYLLAVDRNNPRVAALYNSLHPAVLRALKAIVTTAQRHHKPVSVCGEMGGDPASVLFLLGLGINSLSMSVSSIPRVKWVINQFTVSQTQDIAEHALTLPTTQAVRQFLNERLELNGLGALVRPDPGSIVLSS